MNNFVHEYWSRTEIGRAMIASDSVSDSDLLFLIPNNVKRMHGLPTARMNGNRKSVKKRNRKCFILSFRLFDIISEIIEEMIPKKYNEEFFGQFVDFKNVSAGYKYYFVDELADESNTAIIPAITSLSTRMLSSYENKEN